MYKLALSVVEYKSRELDTCRLLTSLNFWGLIITCAGDISNNKLVNIGSSTLWFAVCKLKWKQNIIYWFEWQPL